jgi:hypothetical protein
MITIKSGRHPLAVSFLGFLAFSGISGLFTYQRSASGTVRSLPEPLGQVLYGGLAAGALVAIVGVFLPGLVGPLLERVGLVLLAGFLFGYAVLAFARAGWPALFVISLLLGLTVGCVWRVVQIGRELRQVRVAALRVHAVEELGGRRERWRVGRHRDRGERSRSVDSGPLLYPPAVEEADSGERKDDGRGGQGEG